MDRWLVVGAGFAGAVLAERLASQLGLKVLVVDKRPHIGGNAYDRYDDTGVLIHPYGPHIFHTNSADVFEYLSQFTQWRPYQHRAGKSRSDDEVVETVDAGILGAAGGVLGRGGRGHVGAPEMGV